MTSVVPGRPELVDRARGVVAAMLAVPDRMPTARAIDREIVAAAALPDSDAKVLAGVIGKDAPLVTMLLRIANSPAQGASVEIRSVEQAIVRLGLKMVRELVLLIALRESVYTVPVQRVLVGTMWQHALATACYAREIARIRGNGTGLEFVCGLMHDAGSPLIVGALAQSAPGLPAALGAAQLQLVVQEFHCQVGAALATRWGMPAAVVESAAWHLSPERAPNHPEMAALVALADQLSHLVANEKPTLTAEDLLENGVIRTLNLHANDLRALVRKHEFVASIVADLG